MKIFNLSRFRDVKDRNQEENRYDFKASQELDESMLSRNGLDDLSEFLKPPMEKYYETIKSHIHPGMKVLELGSGTGLHTKVILDTGAIVTAIDISGNSLEVLKRRVGHQITCIKCSMDSIPIADCSFDYIVSAGSLSYVDLEKIAREIQRLLKPNGSVIFVDSLNNNPMYFANRFIHFLKGNRSFLTLIRMPTLRKLQKLSKNFSESTTNYFGAYLWLTWPLAVLFGEPRMLKVNRSLENNFPFNRFSFKFVFHAQSLVKKSSFCE